MRGLSIDAVILGASVKLEASEGDGDRHLNGALAGAAYEIGFTMTAEDARLGLAGLKQVIKRKVKING